MPNALKELAALQKHRFALALDSISALSRSGYGEEALLERAAKLLEKTFPAEFLIFASLDPDSFAITRLYGRSHPQKFMSRILQNEYVDDDWNKFTQLLQQRSPVNTLTHVTGGDKSRSIRYREVYRKHLGMEHELRAVLRLGKKPACVVSLLRPAFLPDFSASEQRFLAAFCAELENGLRGALVAQFEEGFADPSGMGLVILNEDISVNAVNAIGEQWMFEMGDRFVPFARSMASLVEINGHAGGKNKLPFTPHARWYAGNGRWLSVTGSRLHANGGARKLSLVVEGMRPPQLHSLLFEAYGFTDRERELLHCALRGSSTKAIARELRISEYTVQDYFKSIFDKTGVRSRRDLMAKLMLDCD
ncbi:helix-turn-helix transcriptional regulator [Cohnella caldifontis]|uniref:helix-turn-helix transcriptional regulator n=1 Tax=Cohnella caldifontis TaxID=3027471 RepID=UPI0023EC5B80|nr:helix-turn-helix transcriptional regulator [Cohnella sp. YIM B05605]